MGKFYGKHDGSTGMEAVEYFTLSTDFIQAHHTTASSWQKVRLNLLQAELLPFKDEAGFEQIARELGVPRPQKVRG